MQERQPGPNPSSPPTRRRSLTPGGAPRGSLKSLLRLGGFLRPHWRLVLVCYAAWLGAIGLDAIIPLAIRRAVDEGIAGRDETVLLGAVLAILALYLVKSGFSYAYFALYHYYEAVAARDVRNAIYTALQRLSFSFFDRVETGQLISRATTDVEAARHFLGHGFSALVNVLGTYAVVLTIAFALNWQLTLLSLITLPLLMGIAFYFGKELRPIFARVQQQHGVTTGVLQENLAGIRVVKAFSQEAHEIDKFERAARELLRRQIQMFRLISLRMPIMTVISGVGTIFVIWYGGKMAIEGGLSVGTLIAFNYYLARLMGPTRRIGWIVNQIARAFASADRIFEIMDALPEVREKSGSTALRSPRGAIRFEDVWFEYEPGRPVLCGIDLEVAAGEVVGIVGMTGSGKSALAGLVPRFYDATRGRVLVDENDVRDLSLESLRRNVAIVQQDPFLFSNSLRENIAFGRPQAEQAEVEEVAAQAQVDRFAHGLPAGYETVVGDRGLSLSGGQRQRATLARALLVETPILILDDAVSSVDVETERRIQEALRELRQRKTTLVVAHRISTVQHADRIAFLENGRIVELGTHDELVARAGRYAAVYWKQQGMERREGKEGTDGKDGREGKDGRDGMDGREGTDGREERERTGSPGDVSGRFTGAVLGEAGRRGGEDSLDLAGGESQTVANKADRKAGEVV